MQSTYYVNVIDDGGFTYGMDDVTPVSWLVTRRAPLRRAYRSWTLPIYMHGWARQQMARKATICASRRDLLAIADTLRAA